MATQRKQKTQKITPSDAQVTFQIDQAARDRLEKAAQRQERPISFLCRKAIDMYLESLEREPATA